MMLLLLSCTSLMLRVCAGVDVNKKLRVCDVCGSYLSIFDSDK
jgi:hypothetical protein